MIENGTVSAVADASQDVMTVLHQEKEIATFLMIAGAEEVGEKEIGETETHSHSNRNEAQVLLRNQRSRPQILRIRCQYSNASDV